MSYPIEIRAGGFSLGPEELNCASAAFEQAWATLSTTYGDDTTQIRDRARKRLAMIVIELVGMGSLSPHEILTASIDRMRPSPAI